MSFDLERGQWTDDSSMALCLADSLLARNGYHGGDCRVRYHLWWYCGYNNAFRWDLRRAYRGSVGLGGNISKSLDDLKQYRGVCSASDVPEVFRATGEDSGNGSMMRLAPVPIRYSRDVVSAMAMAARQSYGTHPGADAAVCCTFMAFFISRAIHRTSSSPSTIDTFLDVVVAEFLTDVNPPHAKIMALLRCAPPSPREANWDWKQPRLAMEEALRARGNQYNGHPVSAGYFGAYCMDGLAMALWAIKHSTSLSECCCSRR